MSIFTDIVLFALGVAAMWWLSGHDARFTGENRKTEIISRVIRCVVTLMLAGIFIFLPASPAVAPALLLLALSFYLLWRGCITELFARGFRHLVDPEDDREFDPDKRSRDLDAVARLIQEGRKEEAIQLCQQLKESGDASVLAMDTMLEHLGVPQSSAQKRGPVAEASQLRKEGRFQEAELILNSLLLENPANVDAALMLMRLYAQDMKLGGKAAEALRELEKQPHIARAYIEFARRSIDEWQNPRKETAVVEPLPESIEELLEQGYFGTVIEILEQQARERPGDFDLQMKLAEVQCCRCHNFQLAEKMIRRMETDEHFTPAQVKSAKAKLAEWRQLVGLAGRH
ncbi:MAG TPA: hypothetical protein VMB22_06395 [Verrucomicrobiae bacterium]|nr:hypothetical protein [Verrucomicrobiae bacterium]